MKLSTTHTAVLAITLLAPTLWGCSGAFDGDRATARNVDQTSRGERGIATDRSTDEPGDQMYERPSQEVLKRELTDLQYRVTQEDGTEPAFQNRYWDNKEPGIYVDIVSGEPLFSSRTKFESGTGWPSFTEPLEPSNVVTEKDTSLGMVRTEVRSKHGDSHLGHLFEDGPEPTGLRYCLNSASLRFIPADSLEEEGYGEYAKLFDEVGGTSEK